MSLVRVEHVLPSVILTDSPQHQSASWTHRRLDQEFVAEFDKIRYITLRLGDLNAGNSTGLVFRHSLTNNCTCIKMIDKASEADRYDVMY